MLLLIYHEESSLRTRPIFRFLWIIPLLILLAACNRSPDTPQISDDPFSSPLVSPIVASTGQNIVSPLEGKGSVTGVILNTSYDTQPYADRNIYVAQLIEFERMDGGDGPLFFATLDSNSDPNTWTDANGRFVVENLDPGTYVLAVQLPTLEEQLLESATSGGNISFEIGAGEIIDLGVISIRSNM